MKIIFITGSNLRKIKWPVKQKEYEFHFQLDFLAHYNPLVRNECREWIGLSTKIAGLSGKRTDGWGSAKGVMPLCHRLLILGPISPLTGVLSCLRNRNAQSAEWRGVMEKW